jgi:hypothetical protein
MRKKYDAILYIDNCSINENDSRSYSKGKYMSTTIGPYYDDPKLYNYFSFGNVVNRALNNMSDGYSCQVTDFKKWVVVTVSHSNVITGKSASKTFLIVFNPDKDGVILSTHNRYRTISGVDQAITYIRSACQSLSNETQNRIG